MNELSYYHDNLSKSFDNQTEFFEFLKGIKNRSMWGRKESKNLEVIFIDDNLTEKLKNQYEAIGTDSDILDDTKNNTELMIKADEYYLPVRSCCVKSLLERAGISGSALRRVSRNVYSKILNECLKVAQGNALLRISEGKVSAVLGGDKHEYAILDMEEIFLAAITYLHDTFHDVKYLGGFYEHTMASSMWAIDEEELLMSYQDVLSEHGYNPEEMQPVIRIITSDTGYSGANIYPMLMKKNGRTLTLGNPIKLNHKNRANIEQFKDKLNMIYGKYKLAIEGLGKLLDIEINHPLSCMKNVCKHIGLTKKLSFDAMDLFRMQFGNEPCTAHEIYLGINEIIYFLICQGETGSKISATEETIARALSINWKEHDYPDFSAEPIW